MYTVVIYVYLFTRPAPVGDGYVRKMLKGQKQLKFDARWDRINSTFQSPYTTISGIDLNNMADH